jgi:hypothetical protein
MYSVTNVPICVPKFLLVQPGALTLHREPDVGVGTKSIQDLELGMAHKYCPAPFIVLGETLRSEVLPDLLQCQLNQGMAHGSSHRDTCI